MTGVPTRTWSLAMLLAALSMIGPFSVDMYLPAFHAIGSEFDVPPDAPFTKIPLEADRRAGILTHPYLMTSFAHSDESSPCPPCSGCWWPKRMPPPSES